MGYPQYTMNKKKTLLILLESRDQYNRYRQECALFTEYDHLICALTPHAVSVCEREGVSYFLPEDFYSQDDYYKYKDESESLIKDLVKRLNQYGNYASKDIGFPLELGNYYYLQLYVVIGALHRGAFLLDRVIAKVKPSKVVVFNTKTNNYFLGFRPNPLNGNMYADLLYHSPHRSKLITLDYAYSKKVGTIKPKIKSNLKRIVRTLLVSTGLYGFYQNLSLIKYNIMPDCLPIWRNRSARKILVIGSLYNWKHVFSHPCSTKLFNVRGYPSSDIPSLKPGKDVDIIQKIGWDECFINYDISELIRPQVNSIVRFFEVTRQKHKNVVKKISKYDLVVYSVLPYPQQCYLAHVAQSLGRKAVCYQHGAMNLYRDSLFSEATELLYTDYYLSYGKGVNPKYEKYIGRELKGIEAVGSASMDVLPNNIQNRNDNGYILYATGKYLLNQAPFINVIGSDNRLYDSQKKMFMYLESGEEELKDKKVVFKPNNTPVLGEVLFEVSKVMQTDQFVPFVSLLKGASIIILDAPATTCLETAAFTEKPLFVLMNRMEWFPKPKRLLAKRAVLAETPEELIEYIRSYLITGKYTADVHDREFVKAYATHLDDGRSVDRVIDFLCSITEN